MDLIEEQAQLKCSNASTTTIAKICHNHEEMTLAFRNLRLFLEAIKFEHTVFAMPFALMGMLYAAQGLPSWSVFGWILVAMVGARTAAMAFNRIADRDVDALNPRTRSRALPAGLLSLNQMTLYMLLAIALFIAAAWQLNPLCGWLSPVALAIILGYSYTKRFTALSHLWLGFSLGIAPTAAWIAVRGTLDWQPLFLTLAVTCWVAGFDILYSLQDYEFDTQNRLRSMPQTLGKARAIVVSRGLHALCVISLFAAGIALQTGWLYFVGVALTAVALIYEQSLVSADDLSRLNVAFFTMNGFVSLGLASFAFLDWLL